MGSTQLRTRRPIHLGRIIRSNGAGLSGLKRRAGLSGADYRETPGALLSVAREGSSGGRIIRAGLLRKSGSGTESYSWGGLRGAG